MKKLTRESLLALKIDLPTEDIDVPELGGLVKVKGMTGKELPAFYKSARKGKTTEIDEDTFNGRLVAASLVDDKGERLLKDDEYEVVLEWPGHVLNKLVGAALRVNGLAGGN